MVLIDGKATKSCIVKGKKLEGKNVITIEGLSQKYRKHLHMLLPKQVRFSVDFVYQEWL